MKWKKKQTKRHIAGFIFCLERIRPGGTCKIKQNLSSVVLSEDDIQLNSTMGIYKKELNINCNKNRNIKREREKCV